MPAKQITRSMRAQRILKSARTAKGFTQKNAAAKLGVNRSTLSVWEKDVYAMQLEKFMRLCKLYGISTGQIMELK